MRKVFLKTRVKPHKCPATYFDDGEWWFHQWSTDHEEYQEGPGQFPVAIIENSEGEVRLATVDTIKFQEPEKLSSKSV